MPPKLPAVTREQVRERAGFLCEYCRTDERWQLVQFTIDHIIPIADGGSDGIENLALACFHCNRRKSSKTSSTDRVSDSLTDLFNPITISWNDHFEWSRDALQIIPKSDVGRVTVELLRLNRERILQIRQDDKLVNRHPPKTDR